LGGHHYDYVRCVASAAKQAGFSTVIGTNSRFRHDAALRNFGQVLRVFRRTTYQRDSYLAGLRHLTRSRCDFLAAPRSGRSALFPNLARLWGRAIHRRRRSRIIRGYAQDCERFFSGILFTEFDHAFFATVNEMEFMGLAAYLANHPRTLQANWHLQFHFNLFEGRTPEYQSQSRVARAIQGCFDEALSRIPYHQLHFYATSDTLADQFNRLGVGTFEALAYPVRPELFRSRNAPDPQVGRKTPLRITCPGELRREKKVVQYLQPLVDKIWDQHIATGNVQIVVQRPARRWPARERIELKPPPSARNHANSSWVKYISHPLDEQQYLDLITNTDCGLLFYDSRAYFSRRAGVLGELLSCGKPVIVPAGSWLADQIQEPICRYAATLCQRQQKRRTLSLHELLWDKQNVPLGGGVLSFDEHAHPFEINFELDDQENAFVIQFEWHWPKTHGVYCKLEVFNGRDASVLESTRVIGHRAHELPPAAVFRAAAGFVRVRFTNAYHNSTATIRNLTIQTLSLSDNDFPIGSVGVISADEGDIANGIDEIVHHYEHYQRTAAQFASAWSSRHEPRCTVSHLLAASQPSIRRAG
jgi:hypothetical protein